MTDQSAGGQEQAGESPATVRPPEAEAGAAVLDELRRVLDSREFSGSGRSRKLLAYLVDAALNGGEERLKERTIGVEMFGRESAYDTGQDAIVRVSVNGVRKRLAAYYERMAEAGERAGLRIVLGRGTYTPEFVTAEEDLTPAAVESEPGRGRWMYPALVAALALACVALGVQNWSLRQGPAAQAQLEVLPWSLISSQRDARIVMTDVNFTLYKYMVQREMSLTEYTSARWLGELRELLPGVESVVRTTYTSVTSAVTAARIASLLERSGGAPVIRSARHMQLRDFKDGRPVILIGSAPSDPWVELFHERLNFVIDFDEGRRQQRCRNRAPLAGEQAFYNSAPSAEAESVGYAILSLLANLTGKAPVLILAGTSAEASEAAGELATDIPRLRRELRRLGIDPAGPASQLELLLRVEYMNQTPSRTEVLAHRIVR